MGDLDRGRPRAALKRFRFLGQRWRFLKEEIQQEAFPGFKKVQIENLNLSTSFMTHAADCAARGASGAPEWSASGPPASTDQRQKRPRPPADFHLVTEISLEQELQIQLRNAQLFHRSDVYPAELPVEETDTTCSPRAVPPSSSKSCAPSAGPNNHISGEEANIRRAELMVPSRPSTDLRNSQRCGAQTTKRELVDKLAKSICMKGKDKRVINELKKLDIGRSFKEYTLEKGHRLPLCLSDFDHGTTNVPVAVPKLRDDVLSMKALPIVPGAGSAFPPRPKSRNRTLIVPGLPRADAM